MFWHSLGWRNISLLYWMDLKICFSLHSKGTTQSIVPFVLWVSMEDLLTALALLLSANWGPLMSLDPDYLHHLIPEIWRLSDDEKTAQFGFYCPVSVFIQRRILSHVALTQILQQVDYPIWCHRPSFVIIEPVCRVGLHTAQNVICKAPDLWAPWWLRNWGKLSFTFLGQSGAAECNSSGTGGEIDVPICGEEAPWTFS